jgi:serine/threonine-protein kinase RsbW
MELLFKKEINSILLEVSDLVVLVVEKLRILNINNIIVADVEIALAEALTNIVKHGYHYQSDQKIELLLYKLENMVIIKITDYSEEVELNFNKQLQYDPNNIETLPEGGMGLFLMKQCMDFLELERINNRNVLTMKKYYEE